MSAATAYCISKKGGLHRVRPAMGVTDPEVRKKLSEPRWLQYEHESDQQNWPWWQRLIHHFQRCPICKPEKVREQ